MITISIINIGFSVISAIVLFIAYAVFFNNVNKSWIAVSSLIALSLSLCMLQIAHLEFLMKGTDLLQSIDYRFWLSLAPPMFYLFSRAILLPGLKNSPILLLHLSPLLINLIPQYQVAISMIFLVGTGYSFWIANLIYSLRAQRKRFRFEMFFFGLFAVLAMAILLMVMSISYIDNSYFYLFYSNSIAFSFILIVMALISFPDLLNELAAVATMSYATSSLKDIDVKGRLGRLNELMLSKRLYQNENLNLAMLAEAMELSKHQLSELINVHFAVSFSRYIREQRVEAAKQLLAQEPDCSILAISLETGFKSQSNFYAAFKEITSQSPGDYRKSHSMAS